MTDRSVLQIRPRSPEERQPRAFSDFLDQPNIVVLGNPGAGKTHLFTEAAAAEGARFLTARDFLNLPLRDFTHTETLFIDGLDEQRAGRGDQGTIDKLVQKLFEVAPVKMRISCRAADWLGDTDLAAFKPYFDRGGGAVVVALERLSHDEQINVLASVHMDAPSAEAFLEEAARRDVAEYLGNPESLRMLAKAVRDGRWPATRRELFDKSTQDLLAEHNLAHSRGGHGSFTADELRDAAGACCAVRLISDVAGISLAELSPDPNFPSYRSLSLTDPQKAQAALTRRVFALRNVLESVDYTHRTTAEYLAASWLAERIRAGLPLGRVRALIGIDNHPAPELRGLHAWLAVFLPIYAVELIEADPYGVLTYGDAASLTPSSRLHLLSALGRLADQDPWLNSADRQSTSMGALATPDMIEPFRTALESPTSNARFRNIILDVIAAGNPIPELKSDLTTVLAREGSNYSERAAALTALLRLGSEGEQLVVETYRRCLGSDQNSFRLRAEIIARLYENYFVPEDIACLLHDVLTSVHEVGVGALWPIRRHLPPAAAMPLILDILAPSNTYSHLSFDRRNVREVASLCEHFFVIVLHEPDLALEPASVLQWLKFLDRFRAGHYRMDDESAKEALSSRPDLQREVANIWFATLAADLDACWESYLQFNRLTASVIDSEQMLEWTFEHLERASTGSPQEQFLYELAISLTFSATDRALQIFEGLFSLGEKRSDLQPTRNKMMSCAVAEWRLKDRREQRKDEESEADAREHIRRQFEADVDLIKSGAAKNALAWAAQVYLGLFQDLNEATTPQQRLASIIGDENTAIATVGFVALLETDEVPSFEQIAATYAKGEVFTWWYAFVAGMDELWAKSQDLSLTSDEVLKAALTIDQLYPTFDREGTIMSRTRHGWNSSILETRPEMARDVYMNIVRWALQHPERVNQHISGLHELLHDEALKSFRPNVTLQLLREFPNAPSFCLEQLLRQALGSLAARHQLLDIARQTLTMTNEISHDQRDPWLAAAYLLSPHEFESEVVRIATVREDIIWRLRDLSGNERGSSDSSEPIELDMAQREFLAGLTASRFPLAGYPSNGWSGSRNAWDASDFVRVLISDIAAQPSVLAAQALSRLEQDERLISYRDYIRHASSNQGVLFRAAEYDRPDWGQTIQALANGAPVNVSDLHALLVEHLQDVSRHIASSNTDIYKRFWNEDSHGRIQAPKVEESCRDVLVDVLRQRVSSLGITIEPEGHMAGDRRADISAAMPGRKILCELKRDIHPDLWHAATTQLDRFYTIDPEAKGFGVYGVFWFGSRRQGTIPRAPHGQQVPQSASEMALMLQATIAPETQKRLSVVVIDVSGTR